MRHDNVDAQALPYAPPRQRGRPKAGETHPERIRHIRAVYLVVAAGYQVEQVARAYKISVRTMHRWIRLVRGYTDPEAQALRALAGMEEAGDARPEESRGHRGECRRGRPRKAETPAMRKAVEALIRAEVPADVIARQLGVHRATLYRWKRLREQ